MADRTVKLNTSSFMEPAPIHFSAHAIVTEASLDENGAEVTVVAEGDLDNAPSGTSLPLLTQFSVPLQEAGVFCVGQSLVIVITVHSPVEERDNRPR